MEYRRLGGSGLFVSEVGLGGNNFGWFCDEAQSVLVIQHALELGVNFVDTADMYGETVSEQHVGKALTGRRHEVVLATKTGIPLGKGPNQGGLSYGRVISACEASLRRLNTDYIDLYYLHRPDPHTPLEETLKAYDDLVRQGKVRYVGISNYPAWQACEILWLCDRRGYRAPVVTQNRYNLLDRAMEEELVPFCQEHKVGIIPYSPLASGLLTGKYRAGEPAPPGTRGSITPRLQRSFTDKSFALLASLDQFASARGHTVGELALAWLLAQPAVSAVIPGATKIEQVAANVGAASWKLSENDQIEIKGLLTAGNK